MLVIRNWNQITKYTYTYLKPSETTTNNKNTTQFPWIWFNKCLNIPNFEPCLFLYPCTFVRPFASHQMNAIRYSRGFYSRKALKIGQRSRPHGDRPFRYQKVCTNNGCQKLIPLSPAAKEQIREQQQENALWRLVFSYFWLLFVSLNPLGNKCMANELGG